MCLSCDLEEIRDEIEAVHSHIRDAVQRDDSIETIGRYARNLRRLSRWESLISSIYRDPATNYSSADESRAEMVRSASLGRVDFRTMNENYRSKYWNAPLIVDNPMIGVSARGHAASVNGEYTGVHLAELCGDVPSIVLRIEMDERAASQRFNPIGANAPDSQTQTPGEFDSMPNEETANAPPRVLTCDNCAAIINPGESSHTVGRYVYCAECVSTCDCCGASMPSEDSSEIEIQPTVARPTGLAAWCANCTARHSRTCNDCRRPIAALSRHGSPTHDFADQYCRACASNYSACRGCARPHLTANMVDVNGTRRCAACASRAIPGVNVGAIREYSYRIDVSPFVASGQTLEANAPLLGVELEVEVQSMNRTREVIAQETAARFADRQFTIFKSDGSLNHGFEIVTRPALLETHKEQWENFFANVHPALRSHDTRTCGLHVHLSRASLSGLQTGKMGSFIYHAANQDYVDALSRRKGNSYCKRIVGLTARQAARPQGDRYVAMNITRHTVEFRNFRGTLVSASFFRCLEFVTALRLWVKRTSAAESNNLEAFIRFVEARSAKYPSLAAFHEQWTANRTETLATALA